MKDEDQDKDTDRHKDENEYEEEEERLMTAENEQLAKAHSEKMQRDWHRQR